MKLSVKLLSVFVLLFIVFSFFGCGLFKSVSFTDAKTKLEEAGYEVKTMTGEEYVDSEENQFPTILASELENYLYAKNGEEEIYMFYFYSMGDADSNESFMQMDKLLSGRSNELIYFATKEARKVVFK